jgi:ferredoxin
MNDSEWLPQIDPLSCTGCGDCVQACPTGALALLGEKAMVERPSACTYCAGCEAVCPVSAIALPYMIVFGTAAALPAQPP